MARRKLDQKLADAQHEAAHVVVGVAVGLQLIRATVQESIGPGGKRWLGYAWFAQGAREQMILMTAAGVAWERRCGDLIHAHSDLALLREDRVKTNAAIRALECAAWALLQTRSRAHTLVTRALLEGDVTAAHVRDLARSR